MIPRTTLCYISSGDRWLFIKKTRKNDNNEGKYLGIGGHIEEGESPDECIVREIWEETGLRKEQLRDLTKMGTIDFDSDKYGKEEMHVYICGLAEGIDPTEHKCDEGELVWIGKKEVYDLPIWEGDKIMFDKLIAGERFKMAFRYEGDRLVETRFETL